MLTHDLISKYLQPISPLPTDLHQSGKLDEKVQCVMFDIYGTLFVSRSGDISISKKESKEAWKVQKLLNKFDIRKTPQALLENLFNEIEKEHEGLRENGIDYPEVEIDQIWMRILGNRNLDKIRAFALEFELIVNPVYPMPHLKKMLSVLKDRNILMGIISNAQFYTPYLFNGFLHSNPKDLGFHPDLALYSYKFGYAKPSTFMFQIAADRLENRLIPAHSTLFIGNDMLNDIYPAKQIGFKTALFAGDARSLRLRKDDPRCKNLTADLVITDLGQLLDYIV
jgi:putative hydrolase of the HAD superfamily